MKVHVRNTPPALAPGQLWKNNSSGAIYLAFRPQWDGKGKEIFLLNTDSFASVYSILGGFNYDQSAFTYMGNLEISG